MVKAGRLTHYYDNIFTNRFIELDTSVVRIWWNGKCHWLLFSKQRLSKPSCGMTHIWTVFVHNKCLWEKYNRRYGFVEEICYFRWMVQKSTFANQKNEGKLRATPKYNETMDICSMCQPKMMVVNNVQYLHVWKTFISQPNRRQLLEAHCDSPIVSI